MPAALFGVIIIMAVLVSIFSIHLRTPVSHLATTTPTVVSSVDLPTITAANNIGVVHVALHQQFAVMMGDELSWGISFDPADLVMHVGNAVDTPGYQGIYEATGVGTTTMTAIDAPICNPGVACPQYRVNNTMTLVIGQ